MSRDDAYLLFLFGGVAGTAMFVALLGLVSSQWMMFVGGCVVLAFSVAVGRHLIERDYV